MSEKNIYDVIIIGGGPGGLTAALYAARAGFKTLVLEKMPVFGGQMTQTSEIENYSGIKGSIDGFTLGDNMKKSAEEFGAEIKSTEVKNVDLKSEIKKIITSDNEYYSKNVIIATGAEYKKLNLKDEDSLIGRGISYCAHCDGMFFKNKTVVVVGGGNSAVGDALYLSNICKKVYIVHRRDTLKATKIYHSQLEEKENVEFIWDSVVTEFLYDDKITAIKTQNLKTSEKKEILCDGVFINIGRKPSTDIFKNQITTDENGYIIADESTKTNIKGVYAVGDVRTKSLRQIITAASDGAMAIDCIENNH